MEEVTPLVMELGPNRTATVTIEASSHCTFGRVFIGVAEVKQSGTVVGRKRVKLAGDVTERDVEEELLRWIHGQGAPR